MHCDSKRSAMVVLSSQQRPGPGFIVDGNERVVAAADAEFSYRDEDLKICGGCLLIVASMMVFQEALGTMRPDQPAWGDCRPRITSAVSIRPPRWRHRCQIGLQPRPTW